MNRSTDRILTTHTGSLPRPESLTQLMIAKEKMQRNTRNAAASIDDFRRQVQQNIEVLNYALTGILPEKVDKLQSLAKGARLASEELW